VVDNVRSTRPDARLARLPAQVGLVGELDPVLADVVAELVVRRLRLRGELVLVDLAHVAEHVRGHAAVRVFADRHRLRLDPREVLTVLGDVDELVVADVERDRHRGVGRDAGVVELLADLLRRRLEQLGEAVHDHVELLLVELAVDGDDVGNPVLDQRAALRVEDPAADRRLVDHPHRVALRGRGEVTRRRDLEVPEAGEEGTEQRQDDHPDDAHPDAALDHEESASNGSSMLLTMLAR
jgi:hypothetical protein